jgi:hypothetical protein
MGESHGKAARPATAESRRQNHNGIAPKGVFPEAVMIRCDGCDSATANSENEYGEIICDDCLQNAAERAWERHCEDFHDGGSTRFVSLQQRQADAKKLK